MGVYYGMLVLVGVASLLTSVQCDVSCRGTDGHVGVNGAPGRNGLPGAKGEKGEPAAMVEGLDPDNLLRLKGEAGSQGPQGPTGPKGYRGVLGEAGRPGNPGRPGPNGRNIGQGGRRLQQQTHSAFSVKRTERTYPPYNQIVNQWTTVVNNPGDFDTTTGQFTCRIPGVYYFNFHSTAKASICLNIVSQALPNKLGFCDYNKNQDQTLSGGVVLELAVDQQVWLESFRDQQTAADAADNRDKMIIFNGFLLFYNTE
ncbi:complement C1q subcomponent subunit C-like [Cheilinus undulatus]|uniref:complement C1q subcomponent subunit C-like n=1 Tax=Cheilinus undulatus TaxID=241271 RepID=UPI001BD535C6|nr:complement C1q subcomponent subunit C-like [Cheilinus undulatus]